MNRIDSDRIQIWSATEEKEALCQIADLIQKQLNMDLSVSSDGSAFNTKKGGREKSRGILSVSGELNDDVIFIRMELVRGSEHMRVATGSFFKALSGLSEKVRLIEPQQKESGKVSLLAELKARAVPMSMSRASVFLEEIKCLDDLARSLQSELPVLLVDTDLEKLYKDSEQFAPVYPYHDEGTADGDMMLEWAEETLDFFNGSCCIAVCAAAKSMVDLALAVLAQVCRKRGTSIGYLMAPTFHTKDLVTLVRKAPGFVTVPAQKMALGINPYDLGKEVLGLLNLLSEMNKPVIFTGRHEDQQSAFHGGQGAVNDPLLPVIRHVPEVAIKVLVRFVVLTKAHQTGGLTKAVEDRMVNDTLNALRSLSPVQQRQLLPKVVARQIYLLNAGGNMSARPVSSYVNKLIAVNETFGGLPIKPRASRSPDVQQRFLGFLTDPELIHFLKSNLLGQDAALEELCLRMKSEITTRPLNQPLCWAAVGTPGTGKSESSQLIAQKMGIPHVNIDAASMPDYHTAASQLIGSGRGIVMSHMPGRLEQVAKHHVGALVEVSDLDHANPSVRPYLADFFLQVLGTGELQTSFGTIVSCANLIFCFSMNLPQGMDEVVHKKIGFSNTSLRRDVKKRVSDEVKKMLSGAFLSRVGTPIIFEPLKDRTLASIIEGAVEQAVRSAANSLNVNIQDITIEKHLGIHLLSALETSVTAFGARLLHEVARSKAASAFLELYQSGSLLSDKTLVVSATPKGQVRIKAK